MIHCPPPNLQNSPVGIDWRFLIGDNFIESAVLMIPDEIRFVEVDVRFDPKNDFIPDRLDRNVGGAFVFPLAGRENRRASPPEEAEFSTASVLIPEL